MKLLTKLRCYFFGHTWQNDMHYPVHGYRDTPYPDSHCSDCNITGAEL